jgi:PAS domain S-box-containing protein
VTKVIAQVRCAAVLSSGKFLYKREVLMNTMGSRDAITLLSETDASGRITFVNDAFCRISKYDREELLGKPHNIVRHPEMPKELFERLWGMILRGDVFKAVLKNKARDGSHYWVNATIMAIRDQEDRIAKCIGVRHLIADEKTARQLFEAQSASLGLVKSI